MVIESFNVIIYTNSTYGELQKHGRRSGLDSVGNNCCNGSYIWNRFITNNPINRNGSEHISGDSNRTGIRHYLAS